MRKSRTKSLSKTKVPASVSPERSSAAAKPRRSAIAQEDVGRVRAPTKRAAKTRDEVSVSSERSKEATETKGVTSAPEGTTNTHPDSIHTASVSSEWSNVSANSTRRPTASEGIGNDDSARRPPNSNLLALNRDADALILFYADLLDDAEKMRCATENRHRSLTSAEDWGKGVNPLLPEITVVEGLLESVKAIETGAVKALERALKEHPLGSWVYATKGVGPKQGARFLAAIGNPADRATVSQLWAYCGLHVLHPDQGRSETHSPIVGVDSSGDHRRVEDHVVNVAGSNGGGDSHSVREDQNRRGVAPRRTRGQKANWSSVARSRIYVIAESCLKQKHNGPYYAVYEAGREKYKDAVHHHVCRNSKRPPLRSNGCGTTEHPEWGAIGSPLRPGHQHARAMRLVMKEIVKDLWVEAKARS